MRNKFQNFYIPLPPDEKTTKAIWESNETIFIFDTNALLDLYRYRSETQNEFFKYLEKIKDNVWMPFHVGLEFHNNRIKVLYSSKNRVKDVDQIKDLIIIQYDSINKFQNSYQKKDHPDLYQSVEDLKKLLKDKKTEIDKNIEEAKLKMKDLLSSDGNFESNFLAHKDKILIQFEHIFSDNKIGENLYHSQENIDLLFTSAKQRWGNNIPPGYVDYKEKQDKYFFYNNLKYYNALGDLIIFNEIKELCKKSKHIKNVIFISNDTKEDWKLKNNYEGDKDLGVRPELYNELCNYAPNILFFGILTTDLFLKNSSKFSGEKLDQEIIQDIKNTATHKIKEISDKQLINFPELEHFISQQDKIADLEMHLIKLFEQEKSIQTEIKNLMIDRDEKLARIIQLNNFEKKSPKDYHMLNMAAKKQKTENIYFAIRQQIESLEKQLIEITNQIKISSKDHDEIGKSRLSSTFTIK